MDDVIPDALRQPWETNFEMIKRNQFVPEGVVSLQLNTPDFADASHLMVCGVLCEISLPQWKSFMSVRAIKNEGRTKRILSTQM